MLNARKPSCSSVEDHRPWEAFSVASSLPDRSGTFWVTLILIAATLTASRRAAAAVTREEVERAIREGVRYLEEPAARRRLVV